ncbi:MAG: hypothetical protein ABIJ59_19400 [Pseudomonadota bacterium]
MAFDSENGDWGTYTTKGDTTGAALSAGVEAGFFTGSMSGDTTTLTFGFGPFSVGFVNNFDGDWGLVFGFVPPWLGAQVEASISENSTDFNPFADAVTDTPCD